MSRQYASQLLFEVKFSGIFQNITFVCVVASLISVFIIGYDNIAVSIMFLMLLAIIAVDSVKNNIRRELQWRPDGSWLITQNNQQIKAKLRKGSVVTSCFALLNFKLENNKLLNVVIFKDNIDVEKFRQFRVRIKVEGIQPEEHDTINQ